jgi:hypothetical protein
MPDDTTSARWQEFESLGEEDVRKRLAASIYGEDKARLAREWLDHKRSLRVAEDNAANLASAKEANSLARTANDLAERSLDAARTSNTIAIIALVAAAIAIAVSIIGTFIGKHQ